MMSAGSLPLEFRCRRAPDDVVQPWLLILMHGVGSHADDLMGLAPYVPCNYHVVSLQAPIAMARDAFAWFMFDVNPDGSRAIDVPQEQQSRVLLAQAIAQAQEQWGVPPERTIVGGFSQGGIMALSLLLTQPELLAGVCIWHSRLLPEIVPAQVAPERMQDRHVWLSHGTLDAVIPLDRAHAILHHLLSLPVSLSYSEYPCGHTIHPQELQQCMQWLQALTQSSQTGVTED